MRIQLHVHADGGHLNGQLGAPERPETMPFSGVLDLAAAFEVPSPDPAGTNPSPPETEVT